MTRDLHLWEIGDASPNDPSSRQKIMDAHPKQTDNEDLKKLRNNLLRQNSHL